MPRNAQHIMRTYRKFIIQHKNKHNRDLISQGKDPSRRFMRSLIHYLDYIQSYLKAKQAVLQEQEFVDDSSPRTDICSKCDNIAAPSNITGSKGQVCRAHMTTPE